MKKGVPALTGNFIQWRFGLLCVAITVSLVFLLGRIAWLQIISPDNLVKQEDMRSLREETIDVPRGMIEDRNGKPLAVSVPVEAVWADPKTVMEKGGVLVNSRWQALASALHVPLSEIAARIHSNERGRFIYLARHLLTDPVFSRRASPLSFVGPARRTEVPLDINQLPRLDAVLISHNHYDHLDSQTLRQLVKRFPDVHFFVPLGLKAWFSKRGIEQVTELDWWQSFNWRGMVFTAVPARHWSMRTFWDRNRSLWCGWVVEQGSLRFWFSGDTGYTQSLAEIARRLGPFDMAALPIGAYEPRWFMGDHHMDPQQAVSLWREIGRPTTIPIHWGVFELADESLDQPPQELREALEGEGESSREFSPLRIGQSLPLLRQ